MPLKRCMFSAAIAPDARIVELGMSTGPNLAYYAVHQERTALIVLHSSSASDGLHQLGFSVHTRNRTSPSCCTNPPMLEGCWFADAPSESCLSQDKHAIACDCL